MKRQAAVVGIGRTEYSRKSGRSTLALARECTKAAVADAGLRIDDVEAMVTFQANDSVGTGELAYSLGLEGLYYHSDIFGGGNVAAQVVAHAFWAVESGNCEVAVVYRASWPDELIIRGTLADIREKVRAAKITRTGLILVGRVLDEDGFADSALYDPDHVHVLRPRRKA